MFYSCGLKYDGCEQKYDGWQVIDLGYSCGTLKIPPTWQYTFENELVYILDEESNPVMIEYKYSEDIISNKYYSNIVCDGFVTSACTSNGTVYGLYRIIHNGETKEIQYLDVGYGENMKTFFVWDLSLTEKDLISVAETFVASSVSD